MLATQNERALGQDLGTESASEGVAIQELECGTSFFPGSSQTPDHERAKPVRREVPPAGNLYSSVRTIDCHSVLPLTTFSVAACREVHTNGH